LVVGTFTTTRQSAYAYQQKKENQKGNNGNGDGNTITIQKCKQAATQSGFDNDQGQERENLICTHPGKQCNLYTGRTRSISTSTPTPTPEPITTTLRVIKTLVCQPHRS
jgi:hypothetical protein